MTMPKPSKRSPSSSSFTKEIKKAIEEIGDYAPWVDDPDPPEDMTDEELQELVEGVGALLKKKRK